jgi:hypothetical protein
MAVQDTEADKDGATKAYGCETDADEDIPGKGRGLFIESGHFRAGIDSFDLEPWSADRAQIQFEITFSSDS